MCLNRAQPNNFVPLHTYRPFAWQDDGIVFNIPSDQYPAIPCLKTYLEHSCEIIKMRHADAVTYLNQLKDVIIWGMVHYKYVTDTAMAERELRNLLTVRSLKENPDNMDVFKKYVCNLKNLAISTVQTTVLRNPLYNFAASANLVVYGVSMIFGKNKETSEKRYNDWNRRIFEDTECIRLSAYEILGPYIKIYVKLRHTLEANAPITFIETHDNIINSLTVQLDSMAVFSQ